MEYYYDIYLNFDEYPINYYEWEASDDIERILKIPVIKVEDVKKIIEYHSIIKDVPNRFIISDGINSIALELINKKVAYLSSLSYSDEESVNELAHNLSTTELDITFLDKREIPFELRKESKNKKMFISLINTANPELLKYVYYDLTNKTLNNPDKIKDILLKDISNNFNDKYIELYEKLCK